MTATPATFGEVFEALGIADFADRIFNSNSRGELFHLQDYTNILKWARLPGNEAVLPNFRTMFLEIVKYAEENWARPASVFQHMPKLISSYLKQAKETP